MTTPLHEPRSAAVWPESELEEIGCCPVCRDTRRTPIHRALVDRLGAPGRWVLHRCHACGSGYIDPRPTIGSIGRFYETYYTHDDRVERGVSALGRVRDGLFHGYLNRRFGYRFAPASRLGPIVVRAVPGAAGMATRRVRHLRSPAGQARLLDVGFGAGEFLRRMASAGWAVEGIDPDPTAVDRAREAGLEVRRGTVDDDATPAGRYDAVTLSHSIEHVHDPVSVLAACFRALRPGGVIWISTPNFAAQGNRDFGPSWAALDPPRHLVLFTRASLTGALVQAGFERTVAPPRTLEALGWTYRASEAIRTGFDPMNPPPMPTRLYPKAIAADLRAVVSRRFEEELAIVAEKPRR